jgi:uncharacterized protein YndB with AHSA1/START domain
MTTFTLFLIAVLGAFVVFVSQRPDKFSVTRSATINAPPRAVFEQINDLHKWEAWSPWAKLDPNAKHSYGGAPLGPGASMSWDGNAKVGAGRMTITESRQDERIRLKLEFKRPFESTSSVEFSFAEAGGATTVAWSMSGTHSFFAKAISLFMNCDKMIGGQFEKGLANLKAIAEGGARAAPE